MRTNKGIRHDNMPDVIWQIISKRQMSNERSEGAVGIHFHTVNEVNSENELGDPPVPL